MSNETLEYPRFHSVEQIKATANETGNYFFSPKTLHFFSSRVHSTLYGGHFFVTGERKGFDDYDREYSVRITHQWNATDGDRMTGFVRLNKRFESRSGAHAFAEKLAARVATGEDVAAIVAEYSD